MRRALRLAQNSFSTPNPGVGCVLVRDGKVVGEGWTQPVGQAHAEVMALRSAGERARGSTAYVTLEPCCHWGRTPPCTDALIAAGVARVIAATQDNDPRVGGKGLAILRDSGMAVSVGLLEPEARESNAAFFHFHATHTPFVTLKTAMTLDGKIATRTGHSQWITGARARQYVHKLRAQSGAVMVGIGTLLADDAQLTARTTGTPFPRQPLRIVVDSYLRTPPAAAVVQQASPDTPLLIATTQSAEAERETKLCCPGVEILRLPSTSAGRVDLEALMRVLAEREIISVMVEGGGELNASLLQAGLAHNALFFIAPKLIGGRDAPTPIEGEGIATMTDSLLLGRLKVRRFGPDIALEGRIHVSGQVEISE